MDLLEAIFWRFAIVSASIGLWILVILGVMAVTGHYCR
jgi:hypothetical protein